MRSIFIGIFIVAFLAGILTKIYIFKQEAAKQEKSAAYHENPTKPIDVKELVNKLEDPDVLLVEGGDELAKYNNERQKVTERMKEQYKASVQEMNSRKAMIKDKAEENRIQKQLMNDKIKDQMQKLKDQRER